MGTGLTPNYNFPYAQSTDTVDVSGDLEDLARAIDSDIASIITGLVAGTSMFLGTTSVAFNRASGPLTLAGLTLTTPTIANLTNMNHTHAGATSGGNIPQSSVTSLTSDLALKAPLAGPTFTGTVTAATLDLTTAATATAATSYWVETGSDGILRPKTLANVKTEIVTTAAVNSAAATTVGTVTSGTWSASFGAVSGANLTSLTAANLSGTIPSAVLGNSSVFIGTTSIALNRTSAALTLAGITLTTPTIDSVVSSAAGATNTLWSATTTGSISIGAGLTTGALNLASVGTGVTVITVGHTNSTIALIGAVTVTGSLTATLTGNASTATALQNARTINGTSFNGTANITVTASASTLTSTTLNATVVTSSLTSVGTITSGIWNAGAITSSGGISGTTGTFSSNVSMTQLALNRQDAVNEGGEIAFKRASDNALGFTMDLYGGGTTPGIRLFNAGATNLWYFNNDGTTILPGNLQTNFVADTATAATHYFVEIGTDGYVRPKTLANVKTEIVTTAAVNAAAATTVGTVTSGTWNAGAITTSSNIIAGNGSGNVSLTVNDGYGNANIAFNHYAGIPDANGSSARIVTTVDSTTASMQFQLGDNTSTGVAVGLTSVLTMYKTNIQSTVDFYVTGSKNIYFNDTGTAIGIPAANTMAFTTSGVERVRISSAGLVTMGAGLTVTGTITGTTFSGSGASLTALDGTNISTGTVAVARGGTGVGTSTGTGSVVLSASPTFTGTPAVPTASPGTNTTQIASTAFVTAAVAAGGGGGGGGTAVGFEASFFLGGM